MSRTASDETSAARVDEILTAISTALESAQDLDDISSPEPAAPRAKKVSTKLSVLMPVYNERWTLAEIVDRVLNAPVETDVEIVAVDDCSTDGSWKILQDLAAREPRLRPVRHARNSGKGSAIRTAISRMTGDVAIVQDADLEYDPRDYPRLLAPILRGDADAVFGSRYAASHRQVRSFKHGMINRGLTLVSNVLNDLDLTDMETCLKAVRADVLRQLLLTSRTFTFEPELTSRLAQWGARIYEVPVSYRGRSVEEGKKIRPVDGLKALWEMVRCRFVNPRFTTHDGLYILKSVARAKRYNTWLLGQCREFLGNRVLEAGAGIGNLSRLLLNRERLVLADYDALYVQRLKQAFGRRRNVWAVEADLTDPHVADLWRDERLDTVFCSNVLEHLEPDQQVLRSFHDSLAPGGHCVIIVPANPRLHNRLDETLGHHRRYTQEDLRAKMGRAGFEVVATKQFCKLGTIAWWLNGRVLRRNHLSPGQMTWFDRLWPVTKLLDRCLPVSGMSLMMVGRRTA